MRGVGYAQSYYKYAQISEQVAKFAERNHPSFRWNRNYQAAHSAIISEVSEARLEPHFITTEAEMGSAIKHGTHPGFATLLDEKGRKKKGEFVGELLDLRDATIRRAAANGGNFSTPIMLGSRTQAGNPFEADGETLKSEIKYKSRLVSMIDIGIILVELEFSKPVQDYLSRAAWYGGGKNDDEIFYHLNGYARRNLRHMLTIDYSSYDQTQSAWLIEDAFAIVKAMFRPLTPDEDVRFEAIVKSYIHKWFLTGEGDLLESHKGTPSGDMFTNIIDSVINRLMIETYMRAASVAVYKMTVQGDDNIIYTYESLNPSDLAGYLRKNFGVIVHPEKMWQGYNEHPSFLSRVWTPDGCDRSDGEIIAKLLHPERFVSYGNGVTPEDKFCSYIVSFPVAMRRLFDVERFIDDCFPDRKIVRERMEAVSSGGVRYRLSTLGDEVDHLRLP